MNVFVWGRIGHCSDNYHSEEGVVVFAETIDRAIELATEKGCKFSDEELSPDYSRVVDGGCEAVYIMPDAGCC